MKCAECEEEMEKKRPWQKYCSHKCRNAAHGRRPSNVKAATRVLMDRTPMLKGGGTTNEQMEQIVRDVLEAAKSA